VAAEDGREAARGVDRRVLKDEDGHGGESKWSNFQMVKFPNFEVQIKSGRF
jgi:hypothetical protein